MLPVFLFGIILIVAAAGLLWYSIPPAPPWMRKKRVESPQVEYTPIMEPGPDTDPEPVIELTNDVKESLDPDESGIHHNAEIISDSGWEDLEFVLDELGREQPSSASIMTVLRNPDAGDEELADVCARHAGLTARILDLVNTSFYELLEPVYDLKRAVELLGTSEIRRLAITAGLYRFASLLEGPIPTGEMWAHSLATARITTWLSGHVLNDGIQIRTELAGMGAVLHDVGKIVLKRWRPEGLRRSLRRSREYFCGLMEAELVDMGITHALAAQLLLDRWRIPPPVIWVAKGSHAPLIDPELPEAALVYLSAQMARAMAIGVDGERSEDEIPPDVRSLLKIESPTISGLLDEQFREFVTRTIRVEPAEAKI
jgi:HD-like signal output (HDOD) protein